MGFSAKDTTIDCKLVNGCPMHRGLSRGDIVMDGGSSVSMLVDRSM